VNRSPILDDAASWSAGWTHEAPRIPDSAILVDKSALEVASSFPRCSPVELAPGRFDGEEIDDGGPT
jgi:hypothetical protein